MKDREKLLNRIRKIHMIIKELDSFKEELNKELDELEKENIKDETL